MNASVKIEKPSRAATLEGLLNQLHKADSNHAVFKSYGSTPCAVYSVPEEYVEILHIEGQPDQQITGHAVLQLVDADLNSTQLAYIPADKTKRYIYAPHGSPNGSVVFGNPSLSQPLFVCTQLVAAFKLSNTKLACLLALTNSPAGNLVDVIKDWQRRGYEHICVPVAVHEFEEYKQLLLDLGVHVLSMPSDIHEDDDPNELERGLLALFAAAEREQNAPVAWSNIRILSLQDNQRIPFPTDSYPTKASAAIKAIAKYGQLAEALAGFCVLGALSQVAQGQVNAPKRNKKGGAPCAIFALAAVASGGGKSTARDFSSHVALEIERNAMQAYRADIKLYEATLESKNPADRAAYIFNNPKPVNPKKMYINSTIEPIVCAYIEGSKEAVLDNDEASQLFGGHSFKGENVTEVLGILTSAWDGGTIERTRSKGNANSSGEAYDVTLTISLAGQPEVLAKTLNDPLMKGQGFLARFLFTVPEDLSGTRFLTKEMLNAKPYEDIALVQYYDQLARLYAKVDKSDIPKLLTGEHQKRPVMPISESANLLWMNHFNRVEAELKKGGDYEFIKPFARRAGENALRIATIFTFFEEKSEIDDVAMQGAIDIANFSLFEWLRYYEISVFDQDMQNAKNLESWLVKQCKKTNSNSVSIRDVSRFATPKQLRKKAAMQEALNMLVDHGIVQIYSSNIFLHPSLISSLVQGVG